MTVPASIATIDHDLGEINDRVARCLELIHRCLIDVVSMEFRRDVLLERRSSLTRIDAAAAASMNPGRTQR